ncbi:MAG: LytR C-terminal domain-containing protein [Jatrophihabitantaceae bacterium]
MSRQLARRQRRERLVGIALAALGVVVLVIAVFALRTPDGHGTVAGPATTTTTLTAKSAPKSAPPKTSPDNASSSSPVANKLPLVVLNNTRVAGLAVQAKARFEAGGWTVTSTGNLTDDILSTSAYFDPAVPGAEAGARALQAQFPTIKRVVPKFAQLPPGPIVVVLTPDYS